MFSPSETIDNPVLLDLIFWQIVSDVYINNCIRLNEDEQQQLQKTLKSEGIHAYNPSVYNPKASFKRQLIERTKECPNYFSRLYVVSGGKTLSTVNYLGVTHSGVTLVKRDKTSVQHDCLTLIEKLRYALVYVEIYSQQT